MYNAKFLDSAVIWFWVVLITDIQTHIYTNRDTHTHRPNAKNAIFRIRGPKKAWYLYASTFFRTVNRAFYVLLTANKK